MICEKCRAGQMIEYQRIIKSSGKETIILAGDATDAATSSSTVTTTSGQPWDYDVWFYA